MRSVYGNPRAAIQGLRHSARLRMTSMMDILVVLLLFLLKSFVVDAEVVSPAAGVELPQSTSSVSPEASLVVAVLDDIIVVGDETVAEVAKVMEEEDLLIAPLAATLERMAGQSDELARRRGEEPPPERHATIQGDRDISFAVLQRVMYTLSRSGYEDISLAVIKRS